MLSTTEQLLAPGAHPELITEVPESLLQDLGTTSAKLISLEQIPMITGVPGVTESIYRSPDNVVAEINEALANRDPALGRPEVRAGGTDGLITQRGE